MTHRVLLVAGSVVERGHLEGSLRNAGHRALAAENPREAALLCRQFGPSVVLLLSDLRTPEGQTHLALLLNQPATAAVPVAAIDAGLDDHTAVTLLKTVSGLVASPRMGANLVVALDERFGTDPLDFRRRLAFQRRGATTLRRIGDHLRRTQASGSLVIDGPLSPARVVLRSGRLLEAVADTLSGASAIAALLRHPDEGPWDFTFTAGEAAAMVTSPVASTADADDDDGVDLDVDDDDGVDVDVDVDDGVDVDVDDGTVDDRVEFDDDDDLAHDDVEIAIGDMQETGLSPLPLRHEAPRPLSSVLLVDDDEALVTLYRRTFEHAGYTVHTADNGARGYDAAVTVRPDVIVSDIAMPEKNGWDFLAMVRADPRLSEIPFVLLSCHGTFLRGLQQAAAGADDYIEKGIRAADLRQRVEAVLEARLRLASWHDVPPPSFRERAGVGVFAVMTALSKSRASGQVVVEDGWGRVLLQLAGGVVVNAVAVEADGRTVAVGEEAMIAALDRPEAAIEFFAGAEPSGPSTMSCSPVDALETAANALAERRRTQRELALGDNARLRFNEAPARLYFLVADTVSQALARRFAAGASPRDILAAGDVDPVLVEGVVADLLHKGVAELEPG